MAQETLNKIKDAELQARQMVKDAQSTGAQILEQAKSEARQYRETLLTRSRTDAARRLQEAESGLDAALESADMRAETVTTQLAKNLTGKKAAAVQMVIASII